MGTAPIHGGCREEYHISATAMAGLSEWNSCAPPIIYADCSSEDMVQTYPGHPHIWDHNPILYGIITLYSMSVICMDTIYKFRNPESNHYNNIGFLSQLPVDTYAISKHSMGFKATRISTVIPVKIDWTYI